MLRLQFVGEVQDVILLVGLILRLMPHTSIVFLPLLRGSLVIELRLVLQVMGHTLLRRTPLSLMLLQKLLQLLLVIER